MFKPVTADQLSQFDQETIDLYRKRESDPRLTYALSITHRGRQRHNLPVLVSEPEKNPYIVALQKERDSFPYKIVGLGVLFSFAATRFTKAYYPYGIIVRRSIPRS